MRHAEVVVAAAALTALALSPSLSTASDPPEKSTSPTAADGHSSHWLVPQLHTAGVLLITRIGASIAWPDAFDPTEVSRNAKNFGRAWTSAPEFDTDASFFEWDHDPWALNLIGHGLLGSEIYLRHRQAHHSPWVALALVGAWSVVWEYVVEAWHKQPSGIDLLWTPLGGLALGEGRYQVYCLVRTMPPSAGRRVLLYLLDPLGQLERDLFDLHY